jgi:hypothetical protein
MRSEPSFTQPKKKNIFFLFNIIKKNSTQNYFGKKKSFFFFKKKTWQKGQMSYSSCETLTRRTNAQISLRGSSSHRLIRDQPWFSSQKHTPEKRAGRKKKKKKKCNFVEDVQRIVLQNTADLKHARKLLTSLCFVVRKKNKQKKQTNKPTKQKKKANKQTNFESERMQQMSDSLLKENWKKIIILFLLFF